MSLKLKYYYVNNRKEGTQAEDPPATNTAKQDVSLLPNERDNPIFNFSKDFIKNFLDIQPLDLAQAVPYMELSSLDDQGKDLIKYNITFFSQNADLNKISLNESRYPDRPIMSLKDIQISTTQASGYLSYQEIKMTFRIHKVDNLAYNSILSLMFPGMIFKLRYGWSCLNNKFLDYKEALRINLTNYSLNILNDNQVDLTINGTAFNDIFSNTYIGDIGEVPENDKDLVSTQEQLNSISYRSSQLLQFVDAVKRQQSRDEKSGKEVGLKATVASQYVSATREHIVNSLRKNAAVLLQRLEKESKKNTITVKKEKLNYVSFHDVFKQIFEPCISNLFNSLFKGDTISEYRVIYGAFNDRAQKGNTAIKYVCDFPILWNKFETLKKSMLKKGSSVPTVLAFFNELISETMAKDSYWASFIPTIYAKDFVIPNIVLHFLNRTVGDKEYVEIYIVDAKRDLPNTTKDILDTGYLTDSELYKKVEEKNLSIIKLGHCSSFIKSISMSQIMDEYMKSTMIERMYRNRSLSFRDTLSLTNENSLSSMKTVPMQIPLQGEMTILGSPAWKPYRAFFLDAGVPLLNGVYVITDVVHTLSKEGFFTKVSFRYQ